MTKFTSQDVSDALDTLVKAGLTAEQIMGGALAGALQIASAGSLPAWQAADFAAAAINRAGLNAPCVSGVDAAEAAHQAIRDWEWRAAR